MKNIFNYLYAFAFLFSLNLTAQEISNNAIGLRFGGGNGFGTEISYQRALGDSNRLEIDLGWINDSDFDGFKLVGLYQWVWNLEGDFNWYAGVGGGIGNYEVDILNDSDTFLILAGQVGIEYNFDEIPIQLSLDIRPELGFGDFVDDLDFGVGLGVRYTFD